ncbi:MAG TPA: DUF222 domain-containing protein [Galbitalea sp.]|jgi:hypothetical protein
MDQTAPDLATTLATATRLLGDLAAAANGDRAIVRLADDELCAFTADLEGAGRLLDTLRAFTAAEIDERSRRSLGSDGLAQRLGCVRSALLIEQLTRASQGDAARRIRVGRAISPRSTLGGDALPAEHPALADAMADGAVGVDAASIVIRCLGDASPYVEEDLVVAGEARLVAVAREESTDLVGVHARVWREALNPDGAEPRDEAHRRRRAFTLGREVEGMTPFHGWADPASGALLRAMLSNGANPHAQPRFLSDEDRTAGSGGAASSDHHGDEGVITTFRDPRTREQRQHDILMGVIAAGLRRAEKAPSLRPLSSVTAVVSLHDLENGTGAGWLDDVAEPVSIATIRQLACDGGVRTMILGDAGEVLYLGRAERLFTSAQRKALAVRDGGCVWPGCSAPPGWCEAHHVVEWERGGKTDIDNGALLCSAHHHALHASEFTMKMIDGRPHLLAPPWLDPQSVWRQMGRCRATMAA